MTGLKCTEAGIWTGGGDGVVAPLVFFEDRLVRLPRLLRLLLLEGFLLLILTGFVSFEREPKIRGIDFGLGGASVVEETGDSTLTGSIFGAACEGC